jgi:hypothetical protein
VVGVKKREVKKRGQQLHAWMALGASVSSQLSCPDELPRCFGSRMLCLLSFREKRGGGTAGMSW